MRKLFSLLLAIFMLAFFTPPTYSIDYKEYPGAVTETTQIPVEPGAGDVALEWQSQTAFGRFVSPQAEWGMSYARSKEIAWVRYVGTAKAAGNVYAGQRIVGVCIWYTRSGEKVSNETCSHANSRGTYWVSGPVMIVETWDSINPNAPKTIFNIRTTRINPNIF